MPAVKSRTNNKKKTAEKTFFAPRNQSRPFWALLFLCIGLLMLVAMVGYVPAQSAQNAVGVDVAQNPVGQYGADFCATAYKFLGYVAWALPLLCLWTSVLLFFKRAQKVRWLFLLATVGLLISLSGIFTMADKNSASTTGRPDVSEVGVQWSAGTPPIGSGGLPSGSGGQLGQWSYNDLFIQYIGPFGNGLLLFIVLALSVSLLCPEPILMFWKYLHTQWTQWCEARRVRRQLIREARIKMADERQRQKILAKEARRAHKAAAVAAPRPAAAPASVKPVAPAPVLRPVVRPATPSAPAAAASGGGFERGADAFPAEGAPAKSAGGFFSRLFGRKPRSTQAEWVVRSEPVIPVAATPATAVAPATAATTLAAAPAPAEPAANAAASGRSRSARAAEAGDVVDAPSSSAAASAAAPSAPFVTPSAPASAAVASAAAPVAESATASASAAAPLAVPARAATAQPERPSASGLKVVEVEKTEKASTARPERRGDYIFPSINLLSEPPAENGEDDAQDYEQMMDLLIETLEQFNVKVEKEQVTTGPVITRYEVKPAPGVRVEKILSLDKNLALSLMADSVRILAPVPGRGTVGIEIPNKKPKAVCMREIVESRAWVDAKAEIPVVLGKDVTGRPIVEDLTKMPHMLIAGSTGSGKTVCINAIIASLLYHAGPEDLRFIMVDPKVVEMQVYNALPHMLIPVVTDPKKVPGALKYLLNEMERRYRVFAKVGVRNIAGFNKKLAKDKAEREKLEAMEREQAAALSIEERAAAAEIEVPRDDDVLEVPTKKFPYIVCIIDELADLMMVAPQDIETGVARLAQLARAAGIHLILATQRPSVNVITGVIKANLPTRISFKVASKVDSRTILDQMGADALIGRGDMLFIPPGTSNLVRAQGAFVSDEEINAIVEYLSERNGEPEYAEEVQAAIEAAGEDGNGSAGGGEYDDELVPQAIEIIRTHQRASTSFLQRKLKIGYNRAARIMDILEDEGIVGPDNGPSSPREILE